MNYQQTTQVPNEIFDKHLPNLTESEIKIILVIIRQTYGWIDVNTGKRKIRDRITQSQFVSKAGLSPRIVSKTLKMLSDKELIAITDANSKLLKNSLDRKGKAVLFFSFNPVHFKVSTNAHSDTKPVHKVIYNKTNSTKLNITKGNRLPEQQNTIGSIGEIVENSKYQRFLRFAQ